MSSALLVTKQATISPAGMIGPSWADLREALNENDQLHRDLAIEKQRSSDLHESFLAEKERSRKLSWSNAQLRAQVADGKPSTDRARARVQSLGQVFVRRRAEQTETTLETVRLRGDVTFLVKSWKLTREAMVEPVSPTEWLVLVSLAGTINARQTTAQLAAAVWGDQSVVSVQENTIRTRVSGLRRKLRRLGSAACLPVDGSRGYVLLGSES